MGAYYVKEIKKRYLTVNIDFNCFYLCYFKNNAPTFISPGRPLSVGLKHSKKPLREKSRLLLEGFH